MIVSFVIVIGWVFGEIDFEVSFWGLRVEFLLRSIFGISIYGRKGRELGLGRRRN